MKAILATNLLILLTLIILLFTNVAAACQCISQGGQVWYAATKRCCNMQMPKGNYDDKTQDCNAHSISERLGPFNTCCKMFVTEPDGHKIWSSCRCPHGC